jgi:DNA segregation ATPase FtsK/SpoIIIE, S-DNA-T family
MNIALGPVMSIKDPIYLGRSASNEAVNVTMYGKNMMLNGEPGSGKSGLMNNMIAQVSLMPDARMLGFDAKLVELMPWTDVMDVFVGPEMRKALQTMLWIQKLMDRRYDWMSRNRIRKLVPTPADPAWVLFLDEVAYYTSVAGTKVEQELFSALFRDVVARGRAAAIIPIMGTQRASFDILPTALRDLFAYRWTGRATTPGSSDVALGAGWAEAGYNAMSLDPKKPGDSFLLAEGNAPQRMRAAWMTDEEIQTVAAFAAQLRGHPASA